MTKPKYNQTTKSFFVQTTNSTSWWVVPTWNRWRLFSFFILPTPRAVKGGTVISYIIDINGNINFPGLGFVKVAGLTRLQAVEFLQKQLEVYVEDVVVNIQLMNFKYTVLGQVKAPGVQSVPVGTERLTILEAIAKAGDLQITGLRNNVLLIREVNGQRVEYRLDLTSKDLYQSPAYYIRQNDVIYVEPNFTANFQGTNFQTFTQLGTTAISIFLSLYTIISLTK
jgi:polysaccharide export outer membrane protein